jgi:hypothetical protein
MAYVSRRSAPKGNPLSVEEVIALRNIANRNAVAPPACRLLKGRGLIEQRLGGWILTQQCHIHLLFCNAR